MKFRTVIWDPKSKIEFVWDKNLITTSPILPHFLVHPKAIACGSGLKFYCRCFFPARDLRDAWADRHEILHDGQYWALFYNAGAKFFFGGGTPPKNFRGEKHAKFSPISDDFEVWRRIFPKRMKIFKIGLLFRLPRFLLR